jgi:ubiquitin-conjugating enzyme E2 variant
MLGRSKVRHQDAGELARGYSPFIRLLEIAGILTFFGLLIALVVQLAPGASRWPTIALAALALGYFAADFISGMVHWAADTWGRVDTPLLGKAVLRPFREHHVDPLAITRHDFIETNGNNCLVSIGPMAATLFLPQGEELPYHFFFSALLTSSAAWVLGTNQFHKWAHLPTPPRWIALLQRWRLILPVEHHALHHQAPYNSHYCITAGWLNRPLQAIHFFPLMELLITWATGALPRRDDIGEQAAIEAAPKLEEEAKPLPFPPLP